ncbi:MAG: hypothetical protein OIN89_01290 [Candidatus Methanoperedens sp.]|jgi:hypothetical protein|nr:hypothetical protein [Candidatus Methanoperedens sp.]
MFIEKREIQGYYSLREQFLKDLKIGIQIDSYKKGEKKLRKSLSEQIKNGKLF